MYVSHKASKFYWKRTVEDMFMEVIEHVAQRQNQRPVLIVGDITGGTAGLQLENSPKIWKRQHA